MNLKTVVLITGGFDPIHSGHISYIQAAKRLGDILVVGVNSDDWLRRKKGKPFMSFDERATIVSAITGVDHVIDFDDSDGSAKDAIRRVRMHFPDSKIIFANGGDRISTNIPEMDVEIENLIFLFGIGGEEKKNSSSWILKKWEEANA